MPRARPAASGFSFDLYRSCLTICLLCSLALLALLGRSSRWEPSWPSEKEKMLRSEELRPQEPEPQPQELPPPELTPPPPEAFTSEPLEVTSSFAPSSSSLPAEFPMGVRLTPSPTITGGPSSEQCAKIAFLRIQKTASTTFGQEMMPGRFQEVFCFKKKHRRSPGVCCFRVV